MLNSKGAFLRNTRTRAKGGAGSYPAGQMSPPSKGGWSYPRRSGPGGYVTPTAWGVPTASERGAESKVAHKWARWLHNPCRMGGPTAARAGGRIKGGPQVGGVATYVL